MTLEHFLISVGLGLLIPPAVYVTARVISAGYFHAKFDYHRKILNAIDKEASDGSIQR